MTIGELLDALLMASNHVKAEATYMAESYVDPSHRKSIDSVHSSLVSARKVASALEIAYDNINQEIIDAGFSMDTEIHSAFSQ